MGSFGENLRREREMRGVTLEEIAGSTKISVRFLDALESEEFSKLPGGIFTRSFIRSYANYLGLDPEQVLSEYQSVVPPKNEEDFSRIGVHHAVGATPPGHRTLFAWLAAAALLAGGYALFRYSHQRGDTYANFGNLPRAAKASALTARVPAASNAPEHGVPLPGTTNSEAAGPANLANNSPGAQLGEGGPTPNGLDTRTGITRNTSTRTNGNALNPDADRASEHTEPSPNSGAAAEPPQALGQGAMVLQVAATERSWVAVDCDGKTLLQRILNPSEVRTLRAHDYFNVTTGNAQGITLTLNGHLLKPLGRYGEVKTIRLTLADLNRPTPNP
jgi:cytoskeleton protein RodZ